MAWIIRKCESEASRHQNPTLFMHQRNLKSLIFDQQKAFRQLSKCRALDPVRLDRQGIHQILLTNVPGYRRKFDELIEEKVVDEIAQEIRHYLQMRYAEKISVTAICHELNIGQRTAQRHFEKAFGTTIQQYLNSVRMYMVHSDLLSAKSSEVLIKDVAEEHGFTHIGRFSTNYRKIFNETSLETLENS